MVQDEAKGLLKKLGELKQIVEGEAIRCMGCKVTRHHKRPTQKIEAIEERIKLSSIDYNKLIIAIDKEDSQVYLLVPQLPQLSYGYSVKGYDWYGLSSNAMNSCRNFRTKEEAVKAYSHYNIRNIEPEDFINYVVDK